MSMINGKFGLLCNLGAITVSDKYVHATALADFAKENRRGFYYHDALTDTNFPNPTRILKAGETLFASAWEQTVSGATSSVERMKFLETKESLLVGAQGLTLVFGQKEKRDLLPKGKWYSSFDERKRLWKDVTHGRHRVPYVDADSHGDFDFYLGDFEDDWLGSVAFLCFRDKPLET